jgi:lysophospholipase L1-like esterase
MRRRNRRLALWIALTAVAVSASTIVSTQPADAVERPLNIVAVGDSYASGEGAMGGGWQNTACHRSALAGPSQAADRLIALRPGTTFASAACSGATTANIVGQLNSVAPSGTAVDALTISIGGNNVGFAPLVLACLNPLAASCVSSPEAAFTTNAIANTLPGQLDALFAAINARPGIRNVFVTEYPDPTTGVSGVRCGGVSRHGPFRIPIFNPGFEGFDGIDLAEATFASTSVVMPLNNALTNAVATADGASGPHPRWHLVSGIVSRFNTHGYCTDAPSPNPYSWGNPRFIATPVDSLTSQRDERGSMHPNDKGQVAIADALTDAMSFLTDPMAVTVTSSPTPPVAGSPASIGVQAANSRGDAVSGATVSIDGAAVGTTSTAGTLTVSHVFATKGAHTITVSTPPDPQPDATRTIHVQGQNYTVIPSPDPIPTNTNIPQLVLTTVDGSGAAVPGTFTLVDGLVGMTGTRTRTFRNGDVKTNFKVNLIQTSPWPEPDFACPTLTFKPDSAAYANKAVSELVDCS